MKLLALDLALTASGFAADSGSGVLRPPRSASRGMERLAWIRDAIRPKAAGVDLVMIEGYSFASRGRQHATGELGGVVRLSLAEAGVPFVEVPPSNLKKYATGRGNAPKDQVLAAAVRRLQYQGHDHNEADALWLLEMGRGRYGLPEAVQVPKKNREALHAIDWPDMAPEVVEAASQASLFAGDG